MSPDRSLLALPRELWEPIIKEAITSIKHCDKHDTYLLDLQCVLQVAPTSIDILAFVQKCIELEIKRTQPPTPESDRYSAELTQTLKGSRGCICERPEHPYPRNHLLDMGAVDLLLELFLEMLQRNAGNHLWAELILERAAVVVDDPRDDLGSFYWRTKSRDTKIVGRQIAATPAAKRKRKATSEGEGTIEPVKQARR